MSRWYFIHSYTAFVVINKPLIINFFLNMHKSMSKDLRYGDSAENAVEENSSVFSLIRVRWLPSARACGQ